MKPTILSLTLALTVLVGGGAAHADVPDVLTYAGSLRQGNVPAEGTFSVVVSLFDVPNGGEPLFTQSNPSLVVLDGELVVDIGDDPTNPLDGALLVDGGARFLGIVVDGDELAPRVPLTSVPFALRARSAAEADSVGGLSADDIANLYAAGDGVAKDGTTFSLAQNGVDGRHIADGAVGSTELAFGSVTSAHLAPASVNGTALVPGSVGSDAIADGAVGAAELAADSVGQSELAQNAVGAAELQADCVGSEEIDDGSILGADIAALQISEGKLQNGAVTQAKIANGAVGTEQLVTRGIQGTDIGIGAISAVELASDSVTVSEIATGAVRADEIQNDTIEQRHLDGGGVAMFRKVCGGSDELTLATQCQQTFPCGATVPAGCTSSCGAGSAGTFGTLTCPNALVGFLVEP